MALVAARFRNEPRFLSIASGAVPMKLTDPKERGPAVAIIQRALIDLLRITMPATTTRGEGVPDGIFGEETKDAVKMFQASQQGLTNDGEIGKNTMAKLDAMFAGDSDEISPSTGGPVPDFWQNAFWRTLDDRTNFSATPTFAADRTAFMTGANNFFFQVVKGRLPQGAWDSAVFTINSTGVIGRMSAVQSGVAYERFGKPAPLLTMLDAFERFGQDNLPVDPAHPGPGNKHNMDGGQFMWSQWAAFADAAVKSGVEVNFHLALRRCILAGFWFDGIRRPFPVQTPVGAAPSASDIQRLIRTQTDAQIEQQLRDQCAAALP